MESLREHVPNRDDASLPLDSAAVAQTALQVTDALVVVLGPSGKIRYLNPACESLTGYSAADLLGERIFEVLIPESDRADVQAYWDLLCEEGAPTRFRNHWKAKNGDLRYIMWSNARVSGEQGAPHVVSTGVDITERQRLERDVVHVSETERQRIGQELHDTLASDLVAAAMKLNNLRNRVETETLDEADLLNRLEDVEENVRQGGNRARSLSHLLAAGNLAPEDLSAALADLVQTHGEFSDVECELHLPEQHTGPFVEEASTASHLYRIAQEAVRNAIAHADPDRVTVHVDIDLPDRETGALVRLEVRDDGRGIPESISADLESETRERAALGTEGHARDDGLGLQLMQYRADLIEADLSVSTEGEGGTVIRCEMPVSREILEGA